MAILLTKHLKTLSYTDNSGSWVAGEWVEASTTSDIAGVILQFKQNELKTYSSDQIEITHDDRKLYTYSDVSLNGSITYLDIEYKIISELNYGVYDDVRVYILKRVID